MAEHESIDPIYPYVDGYIDNKIKSLKGRITRLSNRIERLELTGLQEQITSVAKKVKEVDSILLRLERDVAQLNIKQDLLWAQWSFGPLQANVNAANCIRFARETASAALVEVNTSINPHQVAQAWYSKCADYFHKHGGFETFG